LADFGVQPVCHHFFDGVNKETTHPIHFAQCAACGAAQLIDPIPPAKLTPHFDWITYNEPEAHLDALVEVLRNLPGITPQSSICGLSYKEDSTRARLAKLGYTNSWRIDGRADLQITDSHAGMEAVQDRIRPSLVEHLRQRYGAPDMVIARHVLEHTHDPIAFMESLRRWVKSSGYVVFEVPDCARGFDLLDYTTLWEDHTLYFVEPTFLMCLKAGGFSIARFEQYPAAYENCLVGIVQPAAPAGTIWLAHDALEKEKRRAEGFARGWAGRRQGMRELLTHWRQRGNIAIFGAGHQSAMFINLLGVANLIDFVVDDHPHKRGLKMPGSRLPIVGSEALMDGKVKLCLSSLGVESETKIIRKHADFTDQGGTFASIFPVKPNALLNYLAGPVAGL
jgi:hypothetical protein